MSDVMSNIGGFFKTAAPAITGASAGAGLFGNILSSITRGKEIGNLQSAEKKFANLSPEALSGLVSRAEQPLGQDLLQSVGNTVQADMASRGLSQAPGVFAAAETQALAPYKIEQQKIALQLVLKQMGLPIEYADAILKASGGNADVSKLLALLMNQGKSATGGIPTGLTDDTSGGDLISQIINSQAPTDAAPGFSAAPTEGYT